MKIAVVDHGYNLHILKPLLKRYKIEPIVVCTQEKQAYDAVITEARKHFGTNAIVVSYDKALERLRELTDINMLITSYYLEEEDTKDGFSLIDAIRRGNLGEKLKNIPIAMIADFEAFVADDFPSLNIGLIVDEIYTTGPRESLLWFVREVEQLIRRSTN